MKRYVGVVVFVDGTTKTVELTAQNKKLALKDLETLFETVMDQIKKIKVVSK